MSCSRLAALSATTLATWIACGPNAHAAPATQEELNKIRLYGEVTIAEDSVRSWGPWTEFEETAAGPQAAAQGGASTKSETYRPVPQVASPALLGFGVVLQESATLTSPALTPYELSGTITTASDPTSGLPAWPQAIQVRTTALNSGEGTWLSANAPLNLGTGDFWFNYASPSESANPYIALDLYPGGWFYDPQEVQATFYSGKSYAGESAQGTWGVMGTPTSASDLSALRSQRMVATYSGYALDNQGSNPPISMSVNFGNSTFTLTSNGGVDGSVRTETATNGTTLLKGQVGYTATGTVSGVTFSSSTVTTGDQGAISGKVKGAFFGPSAAAAGGVTDLTKNGARYTAPFLAVQPKYLGGGTR